ncbi:tripartite tricarboxylate transporter TctB family protein [Oceaniglobus trochenteri]|uniref:tripartite tricarboxylate transporter TctB family protein n=1 Tax=Oceaniglobus trochenteri TaxID=2763260 RepID=UPI001CFFEA00|nr:tripartite tricarboxylate transporter TctB family protein [Oceaniglobus trochenteri]
MRNLSRKLAASGLIALFALWFLYQIATDLTEKGVASGGALYNAGFVPKGYAILLLTLLAIRTVADLMRYRKSAVAKVPTASLGLEFEEDERLISNATRVTWYRALLVFCLLVVYVLSLDPLGYLISSPALVALLGLALGERRLIALVSWAISLSFGLAVIFGMVFNVVLPIGFLELEF